MQPFELPDFYVPYPARLNPHLPGARAHTMAWAREMKMLDDDRDPGTPDIWDEPALDPHEQKPCGGQNDEGDEEENEAERDQRRGVEVPGRLRELVGDGG